MQHEVYARSTRAHIIRAKEMSAPKSRAPVARALWTERGGQTPTRSLFKCSTLTSSTPSLKSPIS